MQSAISWALLGLVIERPSYTYEFATRFERTYDGALTLSSISHVYTALATLRERGLVQEVPGHSATQRSKRCYEATELGVAEHELWLLRQVSEERRRQHVLMVQLGALARTPQRALEVLSRYEEACLAEMSALPAPGAEQLGPGTTRLVARLSEEETRVSVAAKLKWAQYARTQLQALEQPHRAPGPDEPRGLSS